MGADDPAGFEIDQMGEDIAAGGGQQTRRGVGVDRPDERRDGRRTRCQFGQDLAFARPPMRDKPGEPGVTEIGTDRMPKPSDRPRPDPSAATRQNPRPAESPKIRSMPYSISLFPCLSFPGQRRSCPETPPSLFFQARRRPRACLQALVCLRMRLKDKKKCRF